MKRTLLKIFISILTFVGMTSYTYAQTATPVATWTPSPTLTKTPTMTVTPTMVSLPATCDELTIVSGDNSYFPATVTVSVRGTNVSNTNIKYRFYFGDTQMVESSTVQAQHTYQNSGTYTVVAQVKDYQGNWKSSAACLKTVTVKALPVVTNIEGQRSECSNVFIPSGNQTQAPTTAQFLITGFDNKGPISKYKVDFGDGNVVEQNTPTFERQFTKAGSFVIKGYVYDSTNTWKGGTQGCQVLLTVTSTAPMTQQPSTGTPTWFSIAAMVSGMLSVALFKMRKVIA